MASEAAPHLESLGSSYQIQGELRGRPGRRTFLAKKRDDGTDALIVIISRPEGDERNALSHLAADTKLLIDHKHRNLTRILDGRWVGDDFAVITARVTAPTLREMLDRGEVLSTPRIASILREVNGVLAWAREQKVVHRAVTPDTLFIDPRTDRVFVSFTVRPIKVVGRGDAVEEDARTIGRLAWSMLARSSEGPDEAEQPLAELRPDLPLRVIEATQTLATHEGDGTPLPKVPDYIASIAMAEVLMLGEIETAHVQAVILDEQRSERVKLELERLASEEAHQRNEKRLADEKKDLERQIAAERAELSARREELERSTAKRIAETERDAAKRVAETERDAAKRIAEAEREAARRAEHAEKTFTKQREELERAFAKRHEELERSHAKQKEELERSHARLVQDLEKGFAKRTEELERAAAKQKEELDRAAAKQREELLQERQSTERTLAKQREEFERLMTRERQEFERRIAKEREELYHERAAMERAAEQERRRLASERVQLEQERADVDAYWARTEQRLHDAQALLEQEREPSREPARGPGMTEVGAAALLADAAREREVPRPIDREPAATDATDDDAIPFAPAMLAFTAADHHERAEHLADEHHADPQHEDEHALSRRARHRQEWAARNMARQASAAGTSLPAAGAVRGDAVRGDAVRATHGEAPPPERVQGWRERARKVFGSRWRIGGTGLALAAVVATAIAIGDDDAPTSSAPTASASVMDSAAGSVVVPRAPATPAASPRAGRAVPFTSVVPMPVDYSVGTGVPRSTRPESAARVGADTTPSPRPDSTPDAEPPIEGWRSRGGEPATARPIPIGEAAAPRPMATQGALPRPLPDSVVPSPSLFSRLWTSVTRPDSARRDTAARARPDSVRPDSVRR